MVVDDKIFVLGGDDGSITVCHQVPDMIHRITNFSASLLEGKLMVVGRYKMNFVLGVVEGRCAGMWSFIVQKRKSGPLRPV